MGVVSVVNRILNAFITLCPSVDVLTYVEFHVDGLQSDVLRHNHLGTFIFKRSRGYLIGGGVEFVNGSSYYSLGAFIAGKSKEKVGHVGIDADVAAARLSKRKSPIAVVAALVLSELEVAVPVMAVVDRIGSGIDEVLNMDSVVGEEFFAVAGTNFKYTRLDDFVAPFYAVVEFRIGGFVVNGGYIVGIYAPVQIKLHQKSFGHPFVRLAVGVGVVVLGKVGDDFQKFAFDKFGHIGSRRAVNRLAFLHVAFEDWNIAVVVHQHKVVECAYGAYRGDNRVFAVFTAHLHNDVVACHDSSRE